MKLASIERVTELKPIEGADKILAAKVLGFWTVVRVGEFQVGDFGVWHNPDTVADKDNPVYAFLEKSKWRIYAIRLKKQISQGLLLPLTAFQWEAGPVEGQDVTEKVKLTKYEAPMPEQMKSEAKGIGLPFNIPRTDEYNLLSHPYIWEEIKAKYEEIIITIKYDGQSSTYYRKGDEKGVCSRGYDLLPNPGNGFWKANARYSLLEKLDKTGRNLALQGECYGPGIGGNKLGVPELSFVAFNLYDLDACANIPSEQFLDFCATWTIPAVPTLFIGSPKGWDLESLQQLANDTKYLNGQPAEGIVIRPYKESAICEATGRQLSGKIISESFMLST